MDTIPNCDLNSNPAASTGEAPDASEDREKLLQQQHQRRIQIGLTDDDEQEESGQQDSHCLDRWCCRKWPRCCSCALGVVFPLWLLIFICLIFGSILSNVEASTEVTANDKLLRDQYGARYMGWYLGNLSASITQVCFQQYVQRQQEKMVNLSQTFQSNNNRFYQSNPFSFGLDAASLLSNDTVLINKTELYEFMKYECANTTGPILKGAFQEVISYARGATGSMTFNWIRCQPGASGVGDGGNFFTNAATYTDYNFTEMRPEAQKEYYTTVWEEDARSLYPVIFKTLTDQGVPEVNASAQAFLWATGNATGSGNCTLNPQSAAWFWFTVMTTIGYGNQVPKTTEGRSMLYTLGFASMLVFGAILARAGHITSVIFDDFSERYLWPCFSWNWVGCLIWGTCYYVWITIIAINTMGFKERLDQTLSFEDGYWFAYISTTTIGLGDIFLEPEVIVTTDLFIFPITFLVGFTFLASFIDKLVQLLGWRKQNSLWYAMLDRIKNYDQHSNQNAPKSSEVQVEQATEGNGEVIIP